MQDISVLSTPLKIFPEKIVTNSKDDLIELSIGKNEFILLGDFNEDLYIKMVYVEKT